MKHGVRYESSIIVDVRSIVSTNYERKSRDGFYLNVAYRDGRTESFRVIGLGGSFSKLETFAEIIEDKIKELENE